MEPESTPTQDNQELPTQEVTPPVTPEVKPRKSRRKKVAIVMILLSAFLIGGIVTYVVMRGLDQTADTTANSAEAEKDLSQDTAEIPTYLLQNRNQLSTISPDKSLRPFTTLKDSQEVIASYIKDGVPTVLYSVLTPVEGTEFSGSLDAYGVIDKNGAQDEIALPAGTARYYGPVLSPDRTKMIVEVSDEAGFMASLQVVDVATGAAETVFTPQPFDGSSNKQNESFRVPVAWLDESTVLYQQQSCRQCDGPRVATMYKLDIVSKKMETLFDSSSQNITELENAFAQVILTEDRKRLFVYGGEYTLGDPPANNTNYLYEINTETGVAEFRADLKGDSLSFAGVSMTGDKMYFGVGDSVNDSDNTYDKTPQELYELDVASGESQKIALETRFLEKNNSSITSVYADGDNGLFMSTAFFDFNSLNSQNKQQFGVLHMDLSGDALKVTVVDELEYEGDYTTFAIFKFAQ